jgi:hypothetical protein
MVNKVSCPVLLSPPKVPVDTVWKRSEGAEERYVIFD